MKLKVLALAPLSFFIFMISGVQASELLEVKAVTSGTTVSIEVSADIPMTYTYYKILGQARAVLDIADADPEKIEPLIIVNRGIVSSISVDKAQISEMTVSRLIFNLTRVADISVTASADRKRLTATFSTPPEAIPAPAPVETRKAVIPEPAESTPGMTPPENRALADEPREHESSKPFAELKRGFDDPKSILNKVALPAVGQTAAPPVAQTPAVPVQNPPPAAAEPAPAHSTPKTAETATESYSTSSPLIRSIKSGSSYIDIQTSGNFSSYKIIKLSNPERIAIDIPGAKSMIKTAAVQISKFGISRARLGVYPQYVRIVLDSSESAFPKHSITNSASGLRINFNQLP